MKRLYISSAAVTLFFVSHIALAQTEAASTTASSTESEGGFFSTVIENVTEIKDGVQEQIVGESESALEKQTQVRITNLAANISNRFDGIIARMQNIIDRLSQRIDKQAATGYDTSTARTSLDSAQRSLDEAKGHMSNIDAAVRDALGSTDPRAEWKKVRTKFVVARDAIRIAHAELRNTITALKNSPQTVNETATTSVTTQ